MQFSLLHFSHSSAVISGFSYGLVLILFKLNERMQFTMYSNFSVCSVAFALFCCCYCFGFDWRFCLESVLSIRDIKTSSVEIIKQPIDATDPTRRFSAFCGVVSSNAFSYLISVIFNNSINELLFKRSFRLPRGETGWSCRCTRCEIPR